MAIFTIRNTDVGAPALSGTNGSLITLFDYALVSIAGYTKLFSGTNRAIYKPPAGLGYCLSVIHDSTVSTFAGQATVRGCESATDINTLINPYPPPSLRTDALSTWFISAQATVTTRTYVVICSDGKDGTPPFIIFAPEANSNNSNPVYIWGEAVPIEGADMYCSFIMVKNSNTNSSASLARDYNLFGKVNNNENSGSLFWARSRDGLVQSSQGYIYTPTNQIGGWGYGPTYPDPLTGGLQRQKIILTDNYSQTITLGSKCTFARGYIPNLWNALHKSGRANYLNLNTYDTFTDTAYNPSSTFMAIFGGGASSTATGCLVVETSNTWSKD